VWRTVVHPQDGHSDVEQPEGHQGMGVGGGGGVEDGGGQVLIGDREGVEGAHVASGEGEGEAGEQGMERERTQTV